MQVALECEGQNYQSIHVLPQNKISLPGYLVTVNRSFTKSPRYYSSCILHGLSGKARGRANIWESGSRLRSNHWGGWL